MAIYFELVENTSIGKWHARIRGKNNKIIFATQLYKRKQSAIDACTEVREDAKDAPPIKTLDPQPDENEETRRLRKKMKP